MRKRNAIFGYLFCLPWLIGFIVLTTYPLVYSFYMSFNNITIGATGIETEFVGMNNFIYAFTLDLPFLGSLFETVRTVSLMTPLVIILSLVIGLLLNKIERFKGFFRTLYFLPVIIVSGTLMTILEDNGVFDVVNLDSATIYRWLSGTALSPILYITSFLIGRIFTVLWFSGVQILIYLSGLQKMNTSVYEAASIDGASAWQCFWKITLPALKQFTVINVFYTITMLSTFETNPVIVLIQSNMFGTAINQGLGYSSALSWIYFVVIILMLLVFLFFAGLRITKRKEGVL